MLFICVNYSSIGYAEDTDRQKNVLIINSYNIDFQWTYNENIGIIDAFKKSGDNYSTFFEYIDWKNYPTQENLVNFYNHIKFKYQNKKIDLLIATDDAAFNFVLNNREALFSNAPVVFCGVNVESLAKLNKGFDNFTGVLEEIDPLDTVNMALNINPSLKNIYVIFDNSESGISTGKITMDRILSMNKNFNVIPLNNLTYDDILKEVRSFDKNSIILVTTYYSDVNGKVIEFKYFSREVSKNSSVPVYHLFDMGLNNGAFGGNMISGNLQGESTANLAIRILNGENADDIPYISHKTNRKVIDYIQLKRFDIPLNKISKDTEIINKPFSFFETYKIIVIGSLAAFIILLAFVLILLFYLAKIKNMRKILMNSNEELTQLYEELSASDEELKQQFEELAEVEEKLSVSEDRYRVATDGSNAIIWDLDMSKNQYHFSDRWYELLGYEKGEIDETNGGWKNIIHPNDIMGADKARNLHLQGMTPFYNTEYRMKTKNGQYIWFNVRGKLLKDSKGNIIRFAGSLIDITDRKEYETKLQDSYEELEATYEELTAIQEELKSKYTEILISNEKIKKSEEKLLYLAYYDSLTGLPNKQSLYEKWHNEIFLDQNCRAAALMFIDMDHFKYINDTMGHAFGDKLIVKASERLAFLLKEGATVFRLSGDEFIITMKDISGLDEAEKLASRILAGFKEEFVILNSVLHISLSIGIALFPEHGKNIEEMLKYADIAMYRAKDSGRNSYVVYNIHMNEVFTDRVNIEKYLHTALEKNEFEIYYQPQLDIKFNKITGVEALLRWNSKELGIISPDKFIQIAEDTHLIIPLGIWVLRNACAFIKKIHEKGYKDLTVSVNISILQLFQADFCDIVIDTLEFHDLNPKYLELEITESILMKSYDSIRIKLEKLSEYGIRVALDDFGKGYSSLSHLKQLPISTLKIDKSFIHNIFNNIDNNKNLVTEYIVTLGKSMGMCVIAEGVENREQLDYLIEHECNKIQGFLFSKPIPEEELIKLLKESLS